MTPLEPRTMSLTDLNADVLLLVISFLSPQHALRLSTTCKTMHILATPHALSVISLDKARQIDRCCRALLGHPHARATHVRVLRIPRSAPLVDFKHTSAVQLAALLHETQRLHEIELAPSEAFLAMEPRITLSVGALRHLTDLTLGSVGQHSLDMLRGMCAPVRRLALAFEMAQLGTYADAVLGALRPFRGTLEVLELKHVSSSEALAPEDGLVWPRVRELHLVDTHLPRTTLHGAFPNVRNLDLWLASLVPDGAEDPARNWENLEHVKMANRLDLMKLGLRCPIRRISCPMLPLEECELLRSHEPRSVALSMNHLVDVGPGLGIPFSVHEHALSILAYGEGGFDPLDSLWKMDSCPLGFMYIHFHDSARHSDEECVALSRTLSEWNPALRFVLFSCGENAHGSGLRRVSLGSEQTIEKLTEDEGAKLLQVVRKSCNFQHMVKAAEKICPHAS